MQSLRDHTKEFELDPQSDGEPAKGFKASVDRRQHDGNDFG